MVPDATERDAVYEERNALVFAFATAARQLGWPVGVLYDMAEPDWPVVMIDTPEGQVSWHVPNGAVPSGMPAYPGMGWDGHTTEVKYARLRRLVQQWWWRDGGRDEGMGTGRGGPPLRCLLGFHDMPESGVGTCMRDGCDHYVQSRAGRSGWIKAASPPREGARPSGPPPVRPPEPPADRR